MNDLSARVEGEPWFSSYVLNMAELPEQAFVERVSHPVCLLRL